MVLGTLTTRPGSEKDLEDFQGAIGPEEVLRCYGPRFPRPQLSLGDWVEVFWDDTVQVGWGRLTPDPEESSVWIGYGVFPEARGKGYFLRILDYLCELAFTDWLFPLRMVRVGVLGTNAEHLRAWLAQSDQGPWAYEGSLVLPDGPVSVFHLTPEAWEAAREGGGDG